MGDQELIKPSRDVPVNIEDEMRKSYLDYAMSVIIGRALPDVRDGLKPVHRRILYGMYELGLTADKAYRKCAKIVGEVLGKFHPHGDAAVYDALVRMAQDFNMRYQLVDGQGNFGSVDGDSAAHMRYTEARLTRIAEAMLTDIEKDTVDFIPNFDESEEEPTVLPTRVPGLLINGSDGIAVGMATKIPPHNLTEIIEATILLLNKPTASLEEILALVQGPDFPTGAYIYGKKGIREAYRTGRGQFTMRAKAAIERPAKEKVQIVITAIPFQVNKARTIERIAELVQDKKIEGISDIRDESDRDGMRIVIEIKRGEQPEVILNNLYKHTQLQDTFGMIMLAIVHGQPRILPLSDALQLFIDHRVTVVRRRTEYELRKAQEREHVLEGMVIAIDNLEFVIAVIRLSQSRAEARQNLLTWSQHHTTEQGWIAYHRAQAEARGQIGPQELRRLAGKDSNLKMEGNQITHYRFSYTWSTNRGLVSGSGGLSQAQVDAILELQLHRLTQLSTDELQNELGELKVKIKELQEILASDKVLKKVIGTELKEIQKTYGDARRTEIIEEQDEIRLEDLIAVQDVIITISHSGYTKRTPLTTYRQQARGGKGRLGMKTRDEDFVENLFIASTHSYILVFTNTGKLYWLKVYEIPDVGAAGKGKHILNLVNLSKEEKVAAVLAVKELPEEPKDVTVEGLTLAAEGYITMVTRLGLIKKTRLSDFSNPNSRGIIAMKIEDGDELIAVKLTSGRDNIFLATHEGMAIRFPESDVRDMGRAAYGVYAMDLDKGDYIVGMEIVGDKELILSITEKGYGKRTAITEYRLQTRAGKGVINVKTVERNGKVVSVLPVTEDSEVMIISQQGKITRLDSSTIRESGRSAQGVRLINLEESDQVAAAGLIKTETNGDEPAQGTLIQ